MTEQFLNNAVAIKNRLNELKSHLKSIEFVEKENDKSLKFSISTDDGIISEDLKHQFLPVIPEDFIHDYKIYLQKEIDAQQKQFDNL